MMTREKDALRLFDYIENKRNSMIKHDIQCDQGLTIEGYHILGILNQLFDISQGKSNSLDFSKFGQKKKSLVRDFIDFWKWGDNLPND